MLVSIYRIFGMFQVFYLLSSSKFIFLWFEISFLAVVLKWLICVEIENDKTTDTCMNTQGKMRIKLKFSKMNGS